MGAVNSLLASKFAFYAPSPPSYTVVDDWEMNRYDIPEIRRGTDVDVLKVQTRHGQEIVAVYFKNEKATASILYSHGNATDLGQMFDLFSKLSKQLCVNIMGYDYSGYGQSTGKPSENNTYADIDAAYQCLRDKYGVRAEDIILYGQSAGSGPTVDLASRLPSLGAVVLHSPFLSGLRVVYPIKWTFSFDIFKNIDKISLVNCPVLVIHGMADEIVHHSHGRQLWERCKEKYDPLWLYGAGHNDLERYPVFFKHLKKFLSAVTKQKMAKSGIDRAKNITDIQSEWTESGTSDKGPRGSDPPESSRKSLDSPVERSDEGRSA